MVRGKANHGVFQLAGSLKLLYQVFQRQIQLHIAGNIRPSLFAVRQLRHIILMLEGHAVAAEIIIHMPRYRHIVHMEAVFIDIIGYGCHHHIQIGSRPFVGIFHFKHLTAIDCLVQIPKLTCHEVVAQIRMRPVPLIVGKGIVVERPALYALCRKIIGESKWHPVIRTPL